MRGSATLPDVRVAIGRIGERLRRVRRIPIPGKVTEDAPITGAGRTVAVAANDRGDAAVLATVCGCDRTQLYLSFRRAGRRFGRPLLVTRKAGDVGEFGFWVRPVISMNERGDVLVAWATLGPPEGTIHARVLRNGRWRSSAQLIGPMRDSGSLTAAIGRGGRAIVAWGTMSADTGGGGSGPLEPVTYRFSAAGHDGRFGAARVIEVGTTRGEFFPGIPDIVPRTPRIEARISPAGRALIAWTGADVDHPVVRAATANGSVLEATQTLAAGSLGAVALGPKGEAIVMWRDAAGAIGAASAPAGAAFGAAEQLAQTSITTPLAIALAVNPRTRQPLAIWAGSPDATDYSTRAPIG